MSDREPFLWIRIISEWNHWHGVRPERRMALKSPVNGGGGGGEFSDVNMYAYYALFTKDTIND